MTKNVTLAHAHENITLALGREQLKSKANAMPMAGAAIAMKKNQRNFEEHQRTTNAVMQSLEAIWLRLSR